MSRLFGPSARALWERTRRRVGSLVAGAWRLEPGVAAVPIRTLASPLRFDLEVRRDFLRLCTAHLDGGGEYGADLTGLARSTSYWLWWTEVYCPRSAPQLAADPVARGRAFAERVRASFELCRSFRERGFDARQPIVLKAAGRVLPTDTGKLVRAPLYAGDGCHRVALLWLSGQSDLAPGQYVVKRHRELAPLDNTFRLREAFAGDPSAYLRFIASAYGGGDPASARALLLRTREREPERAAELEALLRVDGVAPLE